MFSQRKSFWKSRWFLLTMVVFLSAGYWFSQTGRFTPGASETEGEEVNQRIDTETPDENTVSSPVVNEDGTHSSQEEEADKKDFFLIKEVDGTIEVYYYQGEGDPVFVRNADIEFGLLSEGDQDMFAEGIIAETEEELDEILQDFGS